MKLLEALVKLSESDNKVWDDFQNIRYKYFDRNKKFRVKEFDEDFYYGINREKFCKDAIKKLGDSWKKLSELYRKEDKDLLWFLKQHACPWQDLEKTYKYLLDCFEGIRQEWKTVQNIKKVLKEKMDVDTGVKAILSISKSVKFFNTDKSKMKLVDWFDPITEKDIRDQIEKFKGTVVLRGHMDFTCQFAFGKVWKFYF